MFVEELKVFGLDGGGVGVFSHLCILAIYLDLRGMIVLCLVLDNTICTVFSVFMVFHERLNIQGLFGLLEMPGFATLAAVAVLGVVTGFSGVLLTYRALEVRYGWGIVFGIVYAVTAVFAADRLGRSLWDVAGDARVGMVLVAVASAGAGLVVASALFRPEYERTLDLEDVELGDSGGSEKREDFSKGD